ARLAVVTVVDDLALLLGLGDVRPGLEVQHLADLDRGLGPGRGGRAEGGGDGEGGAGAEKIAPGDAGSLELGPRLRCLLWARRAGALSTGPETVARGARAVAGGGGWLASLPRPTARWLDGHAHSSRPRCAGNRRPPAGAHRAPPAGGGAEGAPTAGRRRGP